VPTSKRPSIISTVLSVFIATLTGLFLVGIELGLIVMATNSSLGGATRLLAENVGLVWTALTFVAFRNLRRDFVAGTWRLTDLH